MTTRRNQVFFVESLYLDRIQQNGRRILENLFVFFFCIILCNLEGKLPQVSGSLCSGAVNNIPQCTKAVRAIFQDEYHFWFGEDYRRKCSNEGRKKPVACYNPLTNNSDSLSSRLFEPGKFNSKELNGWLRVQYDSPPGSFDACGNLVYVEQNFSLTLDPTTDAILTPWQTRKRPQIDWTFPYSHPTASSSSYTLAFVDAGLGRVLGLFTNIQGNRLENMTEIFPYVGPLNFRSLTNPYVFLLFEQSKKEINISRVWIETFKWPLYRFVQDFASDHNLKGPVAITWMLVSSDLYATEQNRITGWFDNCPLYITNAIQKHHRPFVPRNLSLSVGIYVSFTSKSLVYRSCCSKHKAKAATIELNPLGDGTVKAVQTRTDSIPSVTLTLSTLYDDEKERFAHELYTLLMIDPDIPLVFSNLGNSTHPLIHWMVINIPGNNVSLGEQIHPYMGPLPPDEHPHYYYYFLLRQSRRLNQNDTEGFYSECGEAFQGRCLFQLNSFVDEYLLVFAGATWMVSSNDDYVQGVYLSQGSSPDEVCSQTLLNHPECFQDSGTTSTNRHRIVDIVQSSLVAIFIAQQLFV